MNYSNLTDYQINLRAAKEIYKKHISVQFEKCGKSSVKIKLGLDYFIMNWVDDWELAGQLMEDHKIQLDLERVDAGLWQASDHRYSEIASNKNPRRAVVERFLMMREGE